MKNLSILIALLVIGSIVSAQPTASMAKAAPTSLSGWHLGVDIGISRLDTPPADPVTVNTDDQTIDMTGSFHYGGVGAGAYVGYLAQIAPKFALGGQLGYDLNGQTNYTYLNVNFFSVKSFNVKITSQDISAELLGRYQFNPELSLQAGFGLTSVSQEQTVTNIVSVDPFGGSGPFIEKQSTITQVLPIASLSFNFKVDKRVELYGKVRRLFGASEDNFDNKKVVSAIGLLAGIRYFFA